MPKYEQTDRVLSRMSVWEAIEDKSREEAIIIYTAFDRRFCESKSWDSPISYGELAFFFNDYPKALKWAIEKSFIREVEEEVFYSIGDRFIDNEGKKVLLTQAEHNTVILTEILTGIRYRDPIKVQNEKRITQEEFNMLAETFTFTKIEEKELPLD